MLHHPVTVQREAPNCLSRHRWVFVFEGRQLVLHRYLYEKRSKKADPYKVARFYERGAEGGYGDWEWLTIGDVPWDLDLQGEALAELVKNIVVVREGGEPV